jgi:hypothetical protein
MIAALFPNRPLVHFGQRVIHGDLKGLHQHLDDMHTKYPKFEDDIEFPKVLTVKQLPGKSGN